MKLASLPILLCLLAAGSGGCAGRTPQIRRLTQDSVIVAFGDSLTSGEGASAGESYPSALARTTGYNVVSAGVPGEAAEEAVRRLPSVLQTHRPNLVILCHGGNDILHHREDAAIAQDLKSMVETIQSAGADVILLGVPKPGLRLRAPAFYRDIARECRIPCDTKTLPEILSTPSLKADYVHPNAQGYRRLAEAVALLMTESQSP